MVMKTAEGEGPFYVFFTVRTDRGRQQRLTDGPHDTEKQAEQAMQTRRAGHADPSQEAWAGGLGPRTHGRTDRLMETTEPANWRCGRCDTWNGEQDRACHVCDTTRPTQ